LRISGRYFDVSTVKAFPDRHAHHSMIAVRRSALAHARAVLDVLQRQAAATDVARYQPRQHTATIPHEDVFHVLSGEQAAGLTRFWRTGAGVRLAIP